VLYIDGMNRDLPDEILDDDRMREPDVALRRKPSVWPVFFAYLLAMGAMIGVQLFMLIGLLGMEIADGANLEQLAQNLPDLLATPGGFMMLATGSQIVIGLSAFIGAFFLRQRAGATLGLGKPALAWWGYPFVVLGSFAPAMLGMALATGLAQFLPADDSWERMCASLGWVSGTLFTFFIAFAPGFCEEVFFRGYMQRRLLQAWSPWAAIPLTSLLFAVMHMMPIQVVFTFFLGLWLGLVAWRTGSIWPSMVCHAAWNACAVGMNIALTKLEFDDVPIYAWGLGAAALMPFFAAGLWILLRQPAPPLAASDAPVSPYAENFDDDPPTND
jgi:uncharacterized protein